MDHRQRGAGEQQGGTQPSQGTGSVAQYSPVEQMPFPENGVWGGETPQGQIDSQYPAPPGVTPPPFSDPTTSPGVTPPSIDPMALAKVTTQLTNVETGALPTPSPGTPTREPVVIRGIGKRTGSIRPPKGRRLVVHIAVTSVLLVIMVGTLLLTLPTGSGAHSGNFGIFDPIINIVNTKSNNTALIASQAATATAVTQDGFDPGQNTGQFAGIPTAPPGFGGAGNRFYYGQCTYWAAMRFHVLTGKWVPWPGNANEWAAGGQAYGWVVSNTPKVGSIIVLQAGVQGAGYYGHVAIVEGINPDGTVTTSNWNWAGSWGRTTIVNFTPGYGVSFVYLPGS